MQISIACAEPVDQIWLRIEVPEGSTVQEAIAHSGILRLLPGVELAERKVGVFGKLTELDAPLRAGDRIEIYRAIVADPKTTPRRRMADEEDD